jgi:hypothetical protein
MKRSVFTFALAAPVLLACNGADTLSTQIPIQRSPLTVAVPLQGTLTQGLIKRYSVVVTQSSSYVVSLTSLVDSGATLRIDNGGAVSQNTLVTSPKDFTLRATEGTLDIDVSGEPIERPATNFVLSVVPAPVATTPIVGTSGAIPARTPTVGWVETRSTSRYQTTGLGTGTHTISIVGLTAAADLHVYQDETYTQELDCTLRHQEARECTVPGPNAYFSVAAGGVNGDGAGYVILVW